MCEMCDDDRVTLAGLDADAFQDHDNAARIARDLGIISERIASLPPDDAFGVSDKAVALETCRKLLKQLEG